ncbi:MAG TPA: TolC family protein [Methylomirabilota bacterium]|nr:TolC family protein [Methylomirabilota bacterium]
MKQLVVNSAFRSLRVAASICASVAALNPYLSAQSEQPLALRDALDKALLSNRQLQIEQINQEIAYFTLKAAYGFYDPRFQSRTHTETASDTGGFDPANFSADAVFTADSEVATLGLTGTLPTGLIYSLGGNYAHSQGERNFLNFDSYKLGTGIYLEQPLLRNAWIDQPRWVIQVNKKNLKISELGVRFIAMSVINLTQQGYYDLVYAWENTRLLRDLVNTRSQFVRGIQRQIEMGMMTRLEEKLAQSQTAAIETDLIGSSNLVAQAGNNLRTLMGVTATNWTQEMLVPTDLLILFPENLDLQTAWQSGIAKRPDYTQLAVNLERADITTRYRKNQLFPTLNLFGSYGLKGSDAIQAFPPDEPRARLSTAMDELTNQDAPNSSVGVLFSVPLTSAAERANYKASKEARKQAELLLKQKEELILREISDAIDLARFSYSRAESAKQATRFAQEALQAEEQRLQGGTGSVFLVLQAQTDYTRARSAELIAKRDYNKALTQLYFTEGTLLDRHQLEVRVR